MSTGRIDDQIRWIANRHWFTDSVEGMCHHAREVERVNNYEIQTLLCYVLEGKSANGSTITLAERDGETQIRLHIARAGTGNLGTDEVLIKIIVNE